MSRLLKCPHCERLTLVPKRRGFAQIGKWVAKNQAYEAEEPIREHRCKNDDCGRTTFIHESKPTP